MASPDTAPASQPSKLNAGHLQQSRIYLAEFVRNLDKRRVEDAPTEIENLIRIDNFDLAQEVKEAIAGISDPEARYAIARMAFVVYMSMCQALDPDRKVETEGS